MTCCSCILVKLVTKVFISFRWVSNPEKAARNIFLSSLSFSFSLSLFFVFFLDVLASFFQTQPLLLASSSCDTALPASFTLLSVTISRQPITPSISLKWADFLRLPPVCLLFQSLHTLNRSRRYFLFYLQLSVAHFEPNFLFICVAMSSYAFRAWLLFMQSMFSAHRLMSIFSSSSDHLSYDLFPPSTVSGDEEGEDEVLACEDCIWLGGLL